MKYFLHKRQHSKPAHIWDGKDTYCTQYSTGGIKASSPYVVSDTPQGRAVCILCKNRATKRGETVPSRNGGYPVVPLDLLEDLMKRFPGPLPVHGEEVFSAMDPRLAQAQVIEFLHGQYAAQNPDRPPPTLTSHHTLDLYRTLPPSIARMP